MNRMLIGFIIALTVTPLTVSAADNLSDFQRFRSYPYLDKAYRAVETKDWREVQRLMEHLVEDVPENLEAYRLLAQALREQGNLDAAISVLGDIDDKDAKAQLEELRLAEVYSGQASSEQLSRWLSQSQGRARERLWKTEAQRLIDQQRTQQALNWLVGLSPRGDEVTLHRYRAMLAEQVQDWNTVVVELSPPQLRKKFEDNDWRRLTTALVQTNDIHGLSRLLEQLPKSEQKRYALKAAAETAVSLGLPDLAQRWLRRLETLGPLDNPSRQHLLQTSLEIGDVSTVRRLSDQGALDCLRLSAWLSKRNDPDALSVLRGCDPTQDPQTWLILTDSLEATDLIADHVLPAPWRDRQQRILLNRFTADGRLGDALDLLDHWPENANTLRLRAELERQLGRPLAAAHTWIRHYRLTGQPPSLEQASYMLVDSNRPGEARRLLESELSSTPQNLTPQTLARLADLYRQEPSTLSADKLDTLLKHLSPSERDPLLDSLAHQGRCDLITPLAQQPDSVPPWRAVGLCSPQRPGQAVVAFRLALTDSLARDDTKAVRQDRKTLAYALFNAGDAHGAWQQWQKIAQAGTVARPLEENESLAAARSALAAGDIGNAWRLWALSIDEAGPDSLLLGARIAEAKGDTRRAMNLAEEAVALTDDATTLEAASSLANVAGKQERSLDWLTQAQQQAPETPYLARELGLRLASGNLDDQRRAAVLLEQLPDDFPEDFLSATTLSRLYQSLGDNIRSLNQSRRAIDLQPINLAVGDAEADDMAERRYRLRRQHQTLTQYDRVTLSSAWGPSGPVSGVISENAGAGINTQILEWDHVLGQHAMHQGRQLAAYGRAILGDSDRYDYGEGRSLGLGLRAKPFSDYNINLYTEVFAENQKNDNSHTRYDLLFRASGSFLDQGEYRNDWRPTEADWSERSLYLSSAWWTNSGDVQLLGRFQRGHTFKLPTSSAQTLMPYGAIQASSHDINTWNEDTRLAAGLRWQLWFNEDHYNAFRRKVSIGAEYQQSLGGNLYDARDGWQLNVEISL